MKIARSLFNGGLLLYVALFFAFIYIPLALIIVYSFNANPVNMMVWSGFTTDWYAQVLGFKTVVSESALYIESTDQLVAAVFNSLKIATSTTLISTVLGTALALAMHRYNFLGKRFYQVTLFMPMLMPDIVLGIALLIFFVNAGIHLGLTTIIIGQCTFLISYVFIVVSARLAGMDRTLEHASADLGANEWTTFRKVVMPQLMPGILGGALLAFIISMDDLVITYFIAGVDVTTLPMFIFAMLRRGIKPEINAIAVMMLTFSFVVASLGLYLRSRQK
ncbi:MULTISPECIES: ABC transporter permease [Brucella/Ochrobactrum group]|uniref:Ornithine carbamoyltransferase n=1 Tax=Brucella anthropi (strain ATCC 49188 / DSM 6882 / CCUG 24695 / JCM 21032 / LMG 3331 / NBRC 15819 / NCTC 12168 / Alc 37) TaxID=439375 RepID=A6X2R0_BRUA4|nr:MULTISPECIES: ABC transporter permease [Brucella/Ochrobactrum group]QTN05780.1 ABC transporter permease subunit [Ochrobactrum sp. EEELCW01]ABS15514.1 Ornithine carbamoyltransferase [Brucella anthropi ATCC 49188]AIK42127.1 binding--dependent transport system inner membrane component family protein [Brucella anthropi]KAB2729890.1 ABC transporter permease [Brucella anthropi]KAB2745032.1 ABC transporter permease [Brucella anthropi]